MEINPYAAPQAQVLQTTSQDELVRKEHINTEATIKSVGILYYLGAFALVVFGGSLLVPSNAKSDVFMAFIGAFLAVVGVAQGVTAYGLTAC